MTYSFDFIVDDILSELTTEDKAFIANIKTEKDLYIFQSSFNPFGRAIRNQYNLWYEKLSDEKYKDMHPDDISHEIIVKIWKLLKGYSNE